MQRCKCINVKCKDINRIKSALKETGVIHYPESINKMIKDFLKSDMTMEFVDGSVYLYECRDLDYTTIIAEDAVISAELACRLSSLLNCICIFSFFFGSTYEVNIFNNNICIFNIQKDSNSFIYSNTDRLYAEYDIKNNLSKEQLSEAIDAICNFDDIEDSFCRLECVFGAVLTIGYNYMTDQNIKALEEDGSVTVIAL